MTDAGHWARVTYSNCPLTCLTPSIGNLVWEGRTQALEPDFHPDFVIYHMILHKLLDFFVPQFPHLSNVETSLVGWVDRNRYTTWPVLNTLLLKDLTGSNGSEVCVPDFVATSNGTASHSSSWHYAACLLIEQLLYWLDSAFLCHFSSSLETSCYLGCLSWSFVPN